MKKEKIALLSGLMFILMAFSPCQKVQADPLFSPCQSLNLVSKKHPVPFMGRVNAVISNDPAEAPVVEVIVDGSGNVTHLGKVALHLEEVITFTGPGTGISNQDIRYTAANGDELYVHAISTVVAISADPVIFDVKSTSGEITGGTGRFDGASGNYYLHAIVNIGTGMIQAWVSGTIMY